MATYMTRKAFEYAEEQFGFEEAVYALMLSGAYIESEDGLKDYAETLKDDEYSDNDYAGYIMDVLEEPSESGYYRNIDGDLSPINGIEDIEDLLV